MHGATMRIRGWGHFLGVCAVMLVPLIAGGCDTGPEDAITREAFVEVYVALRVAELRAPDRVISEEARERVLAEHGVTAEALVGFAENHGADIVFMDGVWSEIERKLKELRSKPDTVG